MRHLSAKIIIPVAALALGGAAALVRNAGLPEVSVEMGQPGLVSIKVNEIEILRRGDFKVNQVLLRKPNGETQEGAVAGSVTVDAPSGVSTATYPWGRVAVAYKAVKNRIEIAIDASNTSATDTIEGISFEPVALVFPAKLDEYDGSIPLLTNNVGSPGILSVSWQSGALVVVSEDYDKPLLFGFPWANNRPANTEFPLTVSTGRVRSYPDSYPVIHRPIAPRSTERFRISLRFGRQGDSPAALVKDVLAGYGKAFPSKLDWTDRRPVGAIFLASAESKGPKNPRGWLSDPSLDATSPEGRAVLRQRVLALADTSIQVLKDMNAQGAITWDVEGQEYAHSISYIGDPRMADQLAPEMADVSDAYFKRLRDAGYRVGVCVRPQQLELMSGGAAQRPQADPTALLMEKIRYAKQRWGATLIYLDSNVNAGDPNPLDARILARIHEAFPDILLVPEHSSPLYYAYSAPYKELRQGHTSTLEAIRMIYPTAFTMISTMDGALDYNRKDLMAAVKRGDSVVYRTWYPDPQNEKVKALYSK